MNKILLAFALIVAPFVGFSQAGIVINGTTPVNIVEHGGTAATPIYIVLGNPAATGTKVIAGSTKGYIISENEYDIVKWNIGATTGSYLMPWGYTNGANYYYLPLTVNITAGGTGATAGLLFSTWHTIADQFTGVPSMTGDPHDVTNMGSFWGTGGMPGSADNSWNVVDRFWVIDPSATGSAYTTKPTIGSVGTQGILFSYISATGTPPEVATPNVFAESNLLAQRFNPGAGWGDWLGQGSTDVPGGSVGTAYTGPVAPANFFRSWTLSNSIDPLPITLSSFTAECENGVALIQWTSQSELNNDYYTVKRTTDNVHFETVGTVKADGSGTSDDPENYYITDNTPYPGTSYYFLYQTDVDGKTSQAGVDMFTGCGGSSSTTVINGYNTQSYIEIDINAVAADNYNISLVNMLGQNVLSEYRSVALGSNEIRLNNDFSAGIYILSVRNDKVNYAKKLVLGVR